MSLFIAKFHIHQFNWFHNNPNQMKLKWGENKILTKKTKRRDYIKTPQKHMRQQIVITEKTTNLQMKC